MSNYHHHHHQQNSEPGSSQHLRRKQCYERHRQPRRTNAIVARFGRDRANGELPGTSGEAATTTMHVTTTIASRAACIGILRAGIATAGHGRAHFVRAEAAEALEARRAECFVCVRYYRYYRRSPDPCPEGCSIRCVKHGSARVR